MCLRRKRSPDEPVPTACIPEDLRSWHAKESRHVARPVHAWTFLVRCALVVVCACSLAASSLAQSPLSLFNGTSLLGWTPHGLWTATGGSLTTAGGGNRVVLTAVPFADMRLDFEYDETGPVGARLRLWTNHEGTGGLSIDLDQSGNPAGVGGIETLSHASLNNLAPGWHRVQVEASNGQVNVRIDGQPSGSASGMGSRAGFMGFEVNGDGGLQVRNIKLLPLNLTNLFNGSDLSGWKSVARGPDAKSGVGHTMEKTLTFGIGGGSTKPHEAKWTVRGGAIHGEAGPGGLEDTTNVADGIFQVSASMKGGAKPDNFTALAVRAPSGQLEGGYGIGIGPFAGAIAHVAQHPPSKTSTAVDQTIAVAGRTIAIWVNGNLTTVHTDTRPEANNAAQGAKTGAGAVALLLPRDGEELDVQRVNVQPLPTAYGVTAHAPAPPPPPVPVQAAAPAAPPVAPPSQAEQALVAQQQAAAKKDAADQANKQRVASLMSQALGTTDPQQQMSAYGQVVQIDPSNAAAVQGFKEAQAKVQAQQAAQQQAVTSEQTQQQVAATRDDQTKTSLSKAQSAFLNGHLAEASAALAVAERLSPNNPLARDLRSRISSAQMVRSRLMFLGGGMGLLATAGLIAAWLRRRKQQRYPVLEITRGLEAGRLYALDKDLVRIGAVDRNGAQKNDIVLQDVEHAISRFHCEVARKNGQLYITDLKSSNGTRLNGETLHPGQPELLRKGSTITLANNIDLRFGYDRRAKKNT